MKFDFSSYHAVTMEFMPERYWMKFSYLSDKKYICYDFFENGFLVTITNQKRKNFCYRFDYNSTIHSVPKRVVSMYDFEKKMCSFKVKKDCFFVQAKEKNTVLPPVPVVRMKATKPIKLDDAEVFQANLSYEGSVTFRKKFPVEEFLERICVIHIINNGMRRIEIIPAKKEDMETYPDIHQLKWEYGNVLQHCCADKISFIRKVKRNFPLPQFFLTTCGIQKGIGSCYISCYKKDGMLVISPMERTDYCTGKKIVPANEGMEELSVCNDCAKISPLSFQEAFRTFEQNNIKIQELKDKYSRIMEKGKKNKEYEKAKEVLDLIGSLEAVLS